MAGVQHRIGLLDDVVSRLKTRYPDIIIEVRGAGFLRGMRLHDDIVAGEVTAALREQQFLIVPAADNVIRLLPPLTITEGEIAQAEAHLIACFDSFSVSG